MAIRAPAALLVCISSLSRPCTDASKGASPVTTIFSRAACTGTRAAWIRPSAWSLGGTGAGVAAGVGLRARAFSSRPAPHGILKSVLDQSALRMTRIQRPFAIQLAAKQIRAISSGPTHNVLAHLEATANNNASSASAQNAFYAALLRANMPEILAERYETGRYATSPACDALYQRALERHSTTGTQPSQNFTGEQLQSIAARTGAGVGRGANVRPTSGTGARESPLHVVISESRWTVVLRFIRFFVFWAFVIYLTFILLNLGLELFGFYRKMPNQMSAEVKPEIQKTRFSDVKGCDEAIEELREIVDFLKNPKKYSTLGGKLPKGVLMVGPPGTGKTLLARAVAGESGVPFFYMSGSEFDEIYVGVGAKRVRELFRLAKSKSPAIVFIDELDAVGGKRNERDGAAHMQTLNQMLTELDGFDQQSGVIIMGATNFPQLLDKALTRPGRFDRTVVVPLPDVRGRMAIVEHYMRKMKMGTDVDPSLIARGTPGFSGADIENLVNQAAIRASKNNARLISMADMDWARDRLLMGAERRSMVIKDKDKLMTAYHEAGHALMGHFTGGSDPLYKITILPRGQALGVTHFMPDLDKVSQSKRELLAHIDVCMGGKIAEEIIYGADEVSSGCSSDLENATSYAYAMVTQFGMSDVLGSIAFNSDTYRSLSTDTKIKVEDEVRRILDQSLDRARSLLSSKRKELDLLAKGLIKHETLTKDEMALIINGEELPEHLKDILEPPRQPPSTGTQQPKPQEQTPSSAPFPGFKLPDLPPLPPGFPGTGTSGNAGGKTKG